MMRIRTISFKAVRKVGIGIIALLPLGVFAPVVQAPEPPSRDELLSSLRGHLEFFGADVQDLTDDELEELCTRAVYVFGDIARRSDVSADEAARAIVRVFGQGGTTPYGAGS